MRYKKTIQYESFENKRVLIIGGSSGIGLAAAVSFAENGADVCIMSRSDEKLKKAKEYIVNLKINGQIFTEQMDINDLTFFRKWINRLEDNGESFDILINSSGIYPHIPLSDVKESDWDSVFSTNLRAVFFVSQKIVEHMKKRKWGRIINIASFAAEIPSVCTGIYAASKAALKSLTKSMAAEWAPYNIRVNAVNPGVIQTEMTEKAIKEMGNALKSQIALHRFGSPEEVADVILFLCSDFASYVTGEVINVTGGKFIVQNQGKVWLNEES